MARMSNIRPIIAVAGCGISFVETLIDRSLGDVLIDYRNGTESMKTQIREAAKDIAYAFDGISTPKHQQPWAHC